MCVCVHVCAGKTRVHVQSLSHVRLFVTPWTVAHQALLSKQECWSWLPFPTPENLLDPGIEPSSLATSALAGIFFTTVPPGKPHTYTHTHTHKCVVLKRGTLVVETLQRFNSYRKVFKQNYLHEFFCLSLKVTLNHRNPCSRDICSYSIPSLFSSRIY